MVSVRHILSPRPGGRAGYAAALLTLALIGWGELGRIGGPGSVIWWADGGWTLCACLALAGCLAAARRGGPGRRAWLFFAGGCATWLLGEMAWNYYQLVAHIPPPFPSLGDAGWLGFVPWFAAGIFTLPRGRPQRRGARFFFLDFAIVALAISLIGAIAGQSLLVSSSAVDDWGKATAMAYPVGYLTLGLSVLLLMMRVPSLAAARGLPLLLIGLLCEGTGFVAWTPLLLTNTYQDGTALDLVWMAGLLAIGLAGLEWRQPRARDRARDNNAPPLALVMLGLIPTILGTGVVLVTPLLDEGPLRLPMEIGVAALIILIALRQCAAVLENARLYRAEAMQRGLAQRRAERLRRVQEMGQTLRLDLDPAGIGQHIVAAARADLGYRTAILNLITNPTAPLPEQRVRVVATTGLVAEIAARFLAQDAPATDIFRLLRQEFRLSRSFFLPAEQASSLEETAIPTWTPPLIPTSPHGWQADDALFVPLVEPRTNRFLGFLSVDDPVDGRRPDAETVEMLEIFADHAALAIENARLYAEAQRRTRRGEALGSLLHALGHHLEVDAVLRTGLEGLVRLTRADSATLFDYDPAGQTLIKRAGEGVAIRHLPIGHVVPLQDEPHAARALRSGAPILVTTPQTATEAQALVSLGCRSALAVPLLIGGEPRGLIFINYTDEAPARSTEEHRFAQEVADALAVALEKASLYERARAQALRDPVTDLSNHRAVHQALDAALAPLSDQQPAAALLLLDVDNFKLFNDTFGHPTGDAVLRLVADHLRACSREGDVAGRYGGDEFAVVLPGADRASAEKMAQRLTRAVHAMPYIDENGTLIPLSISIGVAAAPDDGATRQALLAVADARMYAAKHGAAADPALIRSAGDLLGETTFGILEGLVAAVDAKDRYTREHSLDVTRYALMLAATLDLDDADRRALAMAGPLHDIGKIALPDRVLRKPGALTAAEYTIIKTHVTYGVAIVRGILDDAAVIDAIAHHHERYDGRGYPHGLRGAETPLLGRIMQIADAVSAMALDRPYRRGLDAAHVVLELRRGAGTQFDPGLVEPFISAFTALRAAQTRQDQGDAPDLPSPISALRAS